MITILAISTIIYCCVLLIFLLGLFFPNEMRQSEQFTVSVIIAARNEEDNISDILNDLALQTYPDDKFEVIVVNDNSNDNTSNIIQKFVDNYPFIKQVHAKLDDSGILTAKKNAIYQGIKQSNGELILTTDADCRVQKKWIETIVSYFIENVGMVVGFSQLGKKGEHYSIFEQLQAVDFLALLSGAQGSLNFNFPLAATGQNLAYRRKAFDQVDGFKKIGHRMSGDDVLLLQLINKKTNWKIRFAEDTQSFNYTFAEKSFKSFLNQRLRWASNGSYQFILNKVFFLIVLNTFLINLLLSLTIPAAFFFTLNLFSILSCVGFKLFFELLIVLKGAQVYGRKDLIKYFPIWAILQIPYIICAGFLGNIGKFVWKGRRN